jgi:hypothetical protein
MASAKDFHSSASGGANISAHAFSTAQREMIKEQLERILASSLFRNSKRFPDFLRYTVNHVLGGETEGVKERTVGVAVFGRDPDYDTSVDPVVRVTAAEVRKRIALYYKTIGHERELRIEFERGSYVPEFIFPGDVSQREAALAPPASQPVATPHRGTRQWLLIAGLTAPYLALCIFLLGSTRQTALDRFWNPVLSVKSDALVCIPGRSRSVAPAAPSGATLLLQSLALPATPAVPAFPLGVSFGDSVALSLVSEILGSKGKDFHVRATQDVNLDDLREGPVVLIGAFDNQWTMALGSGLRFSFAKDASHLYIADRQNPSSREWSVPLGPLTADETADYGVVSRVVDTTTGRVLIAVGGIHHYGTEAAAECLTNTACLESAANLAPGDWKKTNLQVVLKTTVIGDSSGQPQVVAAYLW